MKRIIYTISLLVGIQSLSSAQQIINVAAGESIQSAINSASIGDTVVIAAGQFNESLFINKSIGVKGAGPYQTIINGGDNGSKAYQENRSMLVYAPCVIKDLAIIQPSTAVDNNHNSMAILLEAAGSTVIENCRIENHITGIYISGSSQNTIKENLLTKNGNGILFAAFMNPSQLNQITNNVITGNGISQENDDAGIKLISNYEGLGNNISENDIFDNTIGINNLSTTTIVANDNWWGDASGPSNGANPNGNGNSVSGFVVFETWFNETVNDEILSTQDLPNTTELKVWPTPTTDKLNVDLGALIDHKVTITVLDINGSIVLEEHANSGNAGITLNVGNLENGIYILQVEANGYATIGKFVKN